jgi:hypothetical protein
MDHAVPILSEKAVAPFVVRGTVGAVMRFAVDLGDERCGATVKVDDIRADRMLTPKLRTRLAPAKSLPQQHLGQAHLAAELSSGNHFPTERLPRSPTTTLRAVPLPVPGRIERRTRHAAHP